MPAFPVNHAKSLRAHCETASLSRRLNEEKAAAKVKAAAVLTMLLVLLTKFWLLFCAAGFAGGSFIG